MFQISFKGLQGTKYVADKQAGEDCWLEALENVIQLSLGDKAGNLNNLSNFIRQRMIADNYPGYNKEEDNVDYPVLRYPQILSLFGIGSEWMTISQPNNMIDHTQLVNALQQNRVVLARVDVKYLPQYKGQTGGHALVLVDVKQDSSGNLYYVGLDSNFPGQECYWARDAIGNALHFKASYQVARQPQLLITSSPASKIFF